MRIEKLIIYRALVTAAWIWSGTVLAAEEQPATEAAPATNGDAAIPAVQSRPALVTRYEQRGEELAHSEEVVWFEVDGQRRWMGTQSARGASLGNILLLAEPDTGANGPSFTATLRASLADYGWRTHFINLTSDDGQAEALVTAAIAQVPQGRPIFVAEGPTCARLVNLESAPQLLALGAGLVCLNVPAAGSQRSVRERLRAFADLSVPTLVLQELPNRWPSYIALAADVEVHVLPPGAPLSNSVGIPGRSSFESSQVLRKLRGWLRRRYAAA